MPQVTVRVMFLLLISSIPAAAEVPQEARGHSAQIGVERGGPGDSRVRLAQGIDIERRIPGAGNLPNPGPGGPGPGSDGPPPSNNLPPSGPSGPGSPPPGASIGRSLKIPVTLETMPGSGTQPRGWLGLNFEAVDSPLSQTLGLLRTGGALVVSTTADGPASKAGMKFGDIVLSFNGRPIGEHTELRQQVAAVPPGSQVMLDVWRAAPEGSDFLATLKSLAEGGNSNMMVRLGNMYARGAGVSRDDAEAVRWFQKGVAARSTSAMVSLAFMIGENRGASKDAAEVYRLLKTAAEAGDLLAANNLGEYYRNGGLLAKNEPEAAKWLKMAAEGGYTTAMVNLGSLYERAEAMARSPIDAVRWYKKAAEAGNASGMTALGLIYLGDSGVAQDDKAAFEWLKKGADGGNLVAITNLAWIYDKGRGTGGVDIEQAATLIMVALDNRFQLAFDQMTQRQFSNRWTREFRGAVQRKLASAGYYSGTIDGEFGPATVDAITTYVNRQR